MTDEQKRKTENRVLFLSIGIMVLLIAFLIYVGVTKQADTLLFPVGLAAGLFLYWIISDVLSVVWLKGFEGRSQEQKQAYYIYAALELIGFGGLAYFIVEMDSMTGALIYIACLFFKKRFRDRYNGVAQEEEAKTGDAETAETSDVLEENGAEPLEAMKEESAESLESIEAERAEISEIEAPERE